MPQSRNSRWTPASATADPSSAHKPSRTRSQQTHRISPLPITHSLVEEMGRPLRQFLVTDPHRLFPFSLAPCSIPNLCVREVTLGYKN
jgi:hypothetical protein